MPRLKPCPRGLPRSLRDLPRLTLAVAGWAASRREVSGYAVALFALPPNGRVALHVSAGFEWCGKVYPLGAAIDVRSEWTAGDASRLVGRVLTRRLLDAKAELERLERKGAEGA